MSPRTISASAHTRVAAFWLYVVVHPTLVDYVAHHFEGIELEINVAAEDDDELPRLWRGWKVQQL